MVLKLAPVGRPRTERVITSPAFGSVAVTVKERLELSSTVWLPTVASSGGELTSLTGSSTVILMSWPSIKPSGSVTRKLTRKLPIWPTAGLQRNKRLAAEKVAPVGSPEAAKNRSESASLGSVAETTSSSNPPVSVTWLSIKLSSGGRLTSVIRIFTVWLALNPSGSVAVKVTS